jgi:hypothetical protein
VIVVDLVRWLGACLDEDERIARAATPGPWVDQGGYVTDSGPDGLPRVQVTDYGTQDGEPEEDNPRGRADSAHIVAFADPARVLREIDAKRRIVELHHAELVEAVNADGDERSGYWCFECDGEPFPCRTLRLLALPYGDRPGYRAEWRP